ncbi:MAG: hypothetical protein WCP73_00100 [Eubacteriales bacterium]
MKKFLIVAVLSAMFFLQGCTMQPENKPAASAQISVASEKPSVAASVQQSSSASAESTPVPSASQKSIDATGVYQGQADSNFIEIKIAGQPEDHAYMVFMLTGELKNNFDSFSLKTGDRVQISYYKNKDGQLVLTNLSKQKDK